MAEMLKRDKESIRDRIDQLKWMKEVRLKGRRTVIALSPIAVVIFLSLDKSNETGWLIILGIVVIAFSLYLAFFDDTKEEDEKIKKNYERLLGGSV